MIPHPAFPVNSCPSHSAARILPWASPPALPCLDEAVPPEPRPAAPRAGLLSGLVTPLQAKATGQWQSHTQLRTEPEWWPTCQARSATYERAGLEMWLRVSRHKGRDGNQAPLPCLRAELWCPSATPSSFCPRRSRGTFLITWRLPPVGFCRARVLEGGRPRRAGRTGNGASGALAKLGAWPKVTGDEVPGSGWCTVLSLFISRGRGCPGGDEHDVDCGESYPLRGQEHR